jgi:hypothetical protein
MVIKNGLKCQLNFSPLVIKRMIKRMTKKILYVPKKLFVYFRFIRDI